MAKPKAPECPRNRNGGRAAALALGLALALGAADDAAAQNVCRGDAPANPAQRIVCEEVSGSANIVIRASNLDIATSGAYARGRGVLARRVRDGGSIGIDIDGGAIATSGEGASGVYVWHSGAAGAVGIDLNDAVVTTSGAYARGVWGIISHPHNAAALTVAVTGGAVTAEGRGVAAGVGAHHGGRGSIALTVGAGAEIRAPFSIGAEGRLTRNYASPDGGRLVVSHGGTIEARDAGILAWAAVRSGHTFGAGAQHADDAARTEPMVHVTSSGDVTVGEAATDAFIRAAIAGADGALSAGEKAVYAAIVAEDSEELGAALAALPAADYDAAWRARANALLTNRGHEPTDVAEEILGLTRSGIRALALPLDIIVAWVQEGVETTSTLSAAERTVLAAVLTGGDLEAALAALPRRAGSDYYDADWMNEMREWAASYNAGDILVEVTGGTIAAEGDGVDARYALTHDRNGAIAVTVANGASVSGGRHGIHVGGAGLAEGNAALRDQTVTVTGAVMGGTGAGIHLAGGGTVVIGRTGRVGASSGVGILSEGAGDLVATVAGTVEGDVRAEGGGDLDATVSGTVDGDLLAQGGALTVDVKEGGAVTGTVHDPVGLLTVHGNIGRLLYGNGGTVTVGDTGRITGVAGEADAIRSEAGDLSVTVAGVVEGDVRATGGDLTFASLAGSRVTGTVHDPAGPLTVAGSIGRLLYTNGGTVTVGGDGRLPRLTGVAVEGGREAVRSEAGDLDVRVEAKGRVTGHVRGMGEGDLRVLVAGTLRGDVIEEEAGDLIATISGTVEGDVFGRGTGEHTVTVSKSGTVTGTIHLAGSTVTVGGTVGRVTLENHGMVTVAPTGRVTGGPGGPGVQVGAGSTVTNRGTIAGKVGIRAGAGSTVVNYGTIRSTDGADGIAVAFPPGENTLTLQPGMTLIGKIQGLTGDDTVDLSNLEVEEVGILTFVDETDTPRTPARIMRPRGMGHFINIGGALVGLDTTAFALTDDMLSDLTGSIHAAVVGTGRSAQPRAGTPAPGHVWATPFGGARNQDGTDTLAAGTHSFGGGLFGAGWGGNALHVGGFLGGSAGRLDVDNRQDVDVQTVFGGVYAQQARGAMRLDARLVLGHMEHDSTRRVGRSTATAEYTAIFFSPEAGLATRLPVTSTLHATPRLRVRYAGLFTEGFRERGTNWDLRVAERAVQILEVRGAVGVPIAVAGGGRLEPRVGLEGRWLLAGEQVEVTVPGGAFRVAAGGDTGVGTGTVGFGLTLPVAAATTLVGNFDGALTTEEAWRALGYLGLTYSF